MTTNTKLVECVPNFSEGRDPCKMEKIVDCFREKSGVKLLDYCNDVDHNRMVVTAVGRPDALKVVVTEAIGKAIQLINLNEHIGAHPRLGSADVVPFIPVQNITMDETVQLAKEVAALVSSRFDLPVYLYEKAASAAHRCNLADVRKGQFEGLTEKMASPLWVPDFGPSTPHPTAGASIIGARNYLIAWNVNLQTDNLDIAKHIAKSVRFSSGGFPCVKALGLALPEQGIVQVSMNLTDFSQTGMFEVFEHIQKEAKTFGVEIVCSELIGVLPLDAVALAAANYLKIKDFSSHRILEYSIFKS
jgi:glutamate formiminotransferase / 5-formyltetrahydrofolate cyclo-ligase